MKTRIGSWLLVGLMMWSSAEVWAKRLGGGASVGRQSSQVVQRNNTQPTPAPAPTPSPSQATPATAPAVAASPAAAKPQRPWGAILGGLAAGLGLAWLASALGFGEAFAQFLLILLLVLAVLAVVTMVRRSRTTGMSRSSLAWQGATGTAASPVTPRGYQPANVGNDASARPWERTQFGDVGSSGGLIGSAVNTGDTANAATSWGIPAGFDVHGFLRASKDNFVRLQAAWDRGDVGALRALMTDDMLAQIQAQLAERMAAQPGAVNVTEVVTLDAQLLGIEDLGDENMARVEFSGLIRENSAEGPAPFREVWNITRPKRGSTGWLVAGVQALQ